MILISEVMCIIARQKSSYMWKLCVAVWLSWQRRWSDQRSYSTPGQVSTGMGDHIGVQLPVWEIYPSLTNHPGQLSLLWVGTMSTGQRVVMLCDWE